jgi:hypothetical protein
MSTGTPIGPSRHALLDLDNRIGHQMMYPALDVRGIPPGHADESFLICVQ